MLLSAPHCPTYIYLSAISVLSYKKIRYIFCVVLKISRYRKITQCRYTKLLNQFTVYFVQILNCLYFINFIKIRFYWSNACFIFLIPYLLYCCISQLFSVLLYLLRVIGLLYLPANHLFALYLYHLSCMHYLQSIYRVLFQNCLVLLY